MSFRSPLGQARGLGSAKEGAQHWWLQRMTAVALIPLTLWLVFGLASNAGGDYAQVLAWVSSPVTAVALILVLVAGFWHGALGLQVVIEDYIHTRWLNLGLLIVVKFGCLLLAVASIFAVLKIALSPATGA